MLNILEQSKQFNLTVRSVIDCLDSALKKNPDYSTEREFNKQCTTKSGLTDKSSPFSVNVDLRLIDPFNRKINGEF